MGPVKGQRVVVERSSGALDVFTLREYESGTGNAVLDKEDLIGGSRLEKSIPLGERQGFKSLNNPYKPRSEYVEIIRSTGERGWFRDEGFTQLDPDEVITATDVVKILGTPRIPLKETAGVREIIRALESHQET
jgi:hypothetical protein